MQKKCWSCANKLCVNVQGIVCGHVQKNVAMCRTNCCGHVPKKMWQCAKIVAIRGTSALVDPTFLNFQKIVCPVERFSPEAETCGSRSRSAPNTAWSLLYESSSTEVETDRALLRPTAPNNRHHDSDIPRTSTWGYRLLPRWIPHSRLSLN